MARVSRARSKQTKVRNVLTPSWVTIERIWAQHGFVLVQLKDGKTNSWDIQMAARVGRSILDGMPDFAPYMRQAQLAMIRKERQRRQELADTFIAVCREAKFQLECPKNTEDRSVAKAVQDSINDISRPLTQDVADRLQKGRLLYPQLSDRELRSVYEGARDFGLTDARVADMLFHVNQERQDAWEKEHKVLEPTLCGFYQDLQRQTLRGADRLKMPSN